MHAWSHGIQPAILDSCIWPQPLMTFATTQTAIFNCED